MMGTCVACGMENVALNEEGKCANCAATSQEMPDQGAAEQTPAEGGSEEQPQA